MLRVFARPRSVVLVASCALTGCVYLLAAGGAKMIESQHQEELEARIRNSIEERTRPWVGKPIADVIAAWGEPYRVDPESWEYVWREQQGEDSLVASNAATVDID